MSNPAAKISNPNPHTFSMVTSVNTTKNGSETTQTEKPCKSQNLRKLNGFDLMSSNRLSLFILKIRKSKYPPKRIAHKTTIPRSTVAATDMSLCKKANNATTINESEYEISVKLISAKL